VFYGGDAGGRVAGAVGDHYSVGVDGVDVRIPRNAQYFDSALQQAVEYLMLDSAIHEYDPFIALAIAYLLLTAHDSR
jgi:hypothetical protein